MLTIQINKPKEIISNFSVNLKLADKSLGEKVKILILRDLLNLNWQININNNKIEISPPERYDKEIIKQGMSLKRKENIKSNLTWITQNIDYARQNLAHGYEVLSAEVDPLIEVCQTRKQHDLFRIFRYYWSSPYSDYVGRRIKFLFRDRSLPNRPIIGIAALGSSIIHIPERDDFIGWNVKTRTKNLIYTMDAYIIGALPPYNYLLGGKLISYLLASKEIRNIYREKYKNKITLKEKRKANILIGIFTTSLFGNSSQYNRLKYNNELLYKPIGYTKGYGTLHLSDETINMMIEYLKSKKIHVGHNFGDGPSWVMRVIRCAGDLLGFDSDILLQHSFKRKIYFVPLAKEYKRFLNDEIKQPLFYNYSKTELVDYWKKRWYENRKENLKVIEDVLKFTPDNFQVI